MVKLKHKSLGGQIDNSEIEKLIKQAQVSSWDELSKMREEIGKSDKKINHSPSRDKLVKHLDANLNGIG